MRASLWPAVGILVVATLGSASAETILQERVDLYDPASGAYQGVEITSFAHDGRRLRQVNYDAQGRPTLVFFVLHDSLGRESEAIYMEGDATDTDREVFGYEDDGRIQTVTYFYDPDTPADRTRIERDGLGREVRKQYFRADGSQYGEESVFWDERGFMEGWEFQYVSSGRRVVFRHVDVEVAEDDLLMRRTRTRDGVPERHEVFSRITTSGTWFTTPARFAPGSVSTSGSETSPSFARDGRTMVFARYDEWDRKDPYIATLYEDGWKVEPLAAIQGGVYTIAISPDGNTILFSTPGDERRLVQIRRDGDGWSAPERLDGLRGSYPCLTDEGDLILYVANGATGEGLYLAPRAIAGFGELSPLFVPEAGGPFDGFAAQIPGSLLVTMCFDGTCESGDRNGIWRIEPDGTREKLEGVPYGWGAQVVESLGILVFTDGEDILVIPMHRVGIDGR